MEDDDEFGDLYTDVLRPLQTSNQFQTGETDAPSSLQGRFIDLDVNSDDEEILHGATDLKNSISNYSPAPEFRLNNSIQGKTLPEPEARPGFGAVDLSLDSRVVDGDDGLELEATVSEKGKGVKLLEKGSSGGLDFIEKEEDDDLNIVVEERETKDDGLVEKDVNCIDKQENIYISAEQNEYKGNYAGQGVAVGEMGSDQMIPGLSGKLENQGVTNLEDEWDSDESEDDLQIVLNDNHGPRGVEMMAGVDDDEDGDKLVIVADNGDMGHQQQQPTLEEHEWRGEELAPGSDGERKELGDAAKASGVPTKVGYSNHLYHHQSYHSQFKYVRPGAAPLSGAVPVTPGGIQGQVRPPITMGPGAGRGRGDWRPRGPGPMQKGPHPGYGVPVWGPNVAGRGYGSGLDFTLPSHKTIFEVDIDGFEEKPWRLPGIDISDFFNFSLNEDSWKDYCKQLEQFRLETTMQSKIRVYESGRMEQDYDPELPPELAAAVGNQEIPSENANAGMSGAAGPLDLAIASARVPPAAPIGRPIPVETGTGDRFPSADTRRPRMHDSDAIIEIFCHSSNDDGIAELDNDLGGEDLGGLDDVDDLQRDVAKRNNCYSLASNGQKREIVARRSQLVTRVETGREGDPHDARCKGRGQTKSSKTNDSDDGENQVTDNQSESYHSEDGKRNRPLSPSLGIESDREQAVAVGDDVHGDSVMDDRSVNTEREEMDVDVTTSDTLEDGKLRRPTNKQTVNDEEEDYKPARSSDNRSRSSKDEDRVVQDRHRPRSGSAKRPPVRDDDNNARRKSYHISGKGREDSHSQRGGALNSLLQHRHVKSDNMDWRKRIRVEDTRKREQGGEVGSRNRGRSERDDEHHGSWVGTTYSQDMGLRHRDRDDNLKNRSEKVDGVPCKRRKEGAYMNREHGEKEERAHNHRESSNSRRKRERDDHSKLKDDDNMSYVRHKEEVLLQKERGERQRDHDEWYMREREETQPIVRSKRPAEDKKWTSHSRGKDDYKGSGREYYSKDVGRHNSQVKKREHVEDDSFLQNKGHEDANAHENQVSGNDEKRATYERPGTSDERDVYASDTSRLHGHRQKEGSRKGKEFESGEYNSLIPSKRNQDEQNVQISEMVNSGGRTEQTNVENDTHVSRQSRKLGKEASSDDDQTTDSRRGRSKLEHWTSHLERDFSTSKTLSSSSSKKSKHLDTYNSGGAPLPSKKAEDDKDASDETNHANAKETEDNTHTNTVEKLKKRSERFKLPMPSGKEALAIKKIVNEPLPSSAQTENRRDSEIKPERPARKRRWTGN